MTARSFFRNLHLIAGLIVGLIAVAVGLSGSVLTFREEIEHALYQPKVAPQTTSVPVKEAYAKAAAMEPDKRRITVVVLPEATDAPLEFVLGMRGARNLKESDQISVYANPYTGEIISQRRRNDSFIAWLRDLHFALLGGITGYKINGWAALVLIFIALTGLVLWVQTYVRGKAFAVNWKASWKRVTWDLHRVLGAIVLVFLIAVAATGAYYPFRETVMKALAGMSLPLPPRGAPAIKPTEGATPLSIDDVMAKARAALPDAKLVVLRPPATPTQSWTATFHRSGDEGESVESGPTAYLDAYTGAVLRLDDPRTMGWTARTLRFIEPLHFGKFGGVLTKLFWVLLGISPTFLFFSGVVMWWNRTRGTRRVAAKTTPQAEVAAEAGS